MKILFFHRFILLFSTLYLDVSHRPQITYTTITFSVCEFVYYLLLLFVFVLFCLVLLVFFCFCLFVCVVGSVFSWVGQIIFLFFFFCIFSLNLFSCHFKSPENLPLQILQVFLLSNQPVIHQFYIFLVNKYFIYNKKKIDSVWLSFWFSLSDVIL